MERDTFTVLVALTVKAASRQEAEAEVTRRINDWFLEDVGQDAPYPPGSLLHWSLRELHQPAVCVSCPDHV